MLAFDNSFHNGYDANDALKLTNPNENFAILSNYKLLSIEARKQIARNDTVFFAISGMHVQAYQLHITPQNISDTGLTAWLEDRFLHITTPVSLTDTTIADFTITSDPASAASDRFMLIFKKRSRHINTWSVNYEKDQRNSKAADIISEIKVYPNPVTDGNLYVQFTNAPHNNYKIQLTAGNKQVLYEQTEVIKTKNQKSKIKIHNIPAGYYQLVITADDGTTATHPVVIQ